MLLLRRLLPFLVAILNGLCLFWQARSPWSYPWLAAVAPVAFAFAGTFIGWRRFPASELAARLLPPMLALVAVAYALLIMEGPIALWVLPAVAAGTSYVALELLFLLAYLPTRYPVNGLSHFNLTLVPGVLFLTHDASVGLTMFVHASRALPVLTLAACGALLFWATAHVETSSGHRRRWSALGGWVGAQLGLLGAFLPVQATMHGAYAALLGAAAIRARRYGISPSPSKGLVMTEAIGVLVLLGLILGTAKWV
jgi:hypothetical protein